MCVLCVVRLQEVDWWLREVPSAWKDEKHFLRDVDEAKDSGCFVGKEGSPTFNSTARTLK